MKTYSVKTYLTRFTLTVTAALVIITLSEIGRAHV